MSRDRTLEDTFFIAFTTRAFATGIPTVLSGTPVVSAYEDAGTTEITAGITLGADHDTVAGLNMLTIVATAANGYEAGKDYNLVITTGTVSSVSVVGEVVGQFSLGLSAAAVDLANGTDGLGAIKADTAATLIDTAAMQPLVAKIPLSDGVITWNSTALASVNAECDTAMTDYDGPTNAEMIARTILAAAYFDPAADTVANVTLTATTTAVTNRVTANSDQIAGDATAATNLSKSTIGIEPGAAIAGTLSITQMTTDLTETTDDHYNGRIIVWTTGALKNQATDITDYAGGTKLLTFTATTEAPIATDEFVII